MPAKPAIKLNDDELLAFQRSIISCDGKLNWNFTDLFTTFNLLDLTISISDNRIITKI